MIDLGVFTIGLGVGAAIVFFIRFYPEWRQYVAFAFCPNPGGCPHHCEEWRKRITAANDNERNGPARPKF